MKNIEAIRCPSCGSSDIEHINNSIGKCAHCGSTMLLPKQNGEIVALLNNAYVYRSNFNYDLAIKSYQFVIEKDSSELSAYEGILLSEYGIEYVKDSYTGRLVPTCHRAHFTSIYDNEYYKTLITLANEEQKIVINEKAKEIDKLQKAIERQLKNEQEYDIFISYKATDVNGDKTEDSVIAREIYDELTSKNYKVFFAEKSLEDRMGSEYEPIIFKALHTSKLFILVGTSKENVESNWVRNEWSRYIDRIKTEDGLTKNSFIPVFKDMNPYDMPKVNNSFVQGVDAGKLGYITTLTDGVTKLLKPEKEQKVLDTFADLDNFAEFSRLQKQKQKELKERNWKSFTQTKGVKKWLYYAFIYLPTIVSALYLVLSAITESHFKQGETFVLFHIVFCVQIAISVVALCVHAKRFRINKLINVVVPFVSLAMGFIVFLSLYFFYPITICGKTARDIGMNMGREDGMYYYDTGVEGNKTLVAVETFDRNNAFEKKYTKIENGKKVLYLPKEVEGYTISEFNAAIPDDVQIIVFPKITWEEHKEKNYNYYRFRNDQSSAKSLEAIYCFDKNCISIYFEGLDTRMPCKIYYEEVAGNDLFKEDAGYYERKTGGYYGRDTLPHLLVQEPDLLI